MMMCALACSFWQYTLSLWWRKNSYRAEFFYQRKLNIMSVSTLICKQQKPTPEQKENMCEDILELKGGWRAKLRKGVRTTAMIHICVHMPKCLCMCMYICMCMHAHTHTCALRAIVCSVSLTSKDLSPSWSCVLALRVPESKSAASLWLAKLENIPIHTKCWKLLFAES